MRDISWCRRKTVAEYKTQSEIESTLPPTTFAVLHADVRGSYPVRRGDAKHTLKAERDKEYVYVYV